MKYEHDRESQNLISSKIQLQLTDQKLLRDWLSSSLILYERREFFIMWKMSFKSMQMEENC